MDRIEQASVIPVRLKADQVEVCLVTSLRKKRWIFPKGIIDEGETTEEAGLKEAWEEAGLEGQIVGAVVGQFKDRKWGAQLTVSVLVMEVSSESDTWPEADQRERRWCSVDEAQGLLHRKELRELVASVTLDTVRSASRA